MGVFGGLALRVSGLRIGFTVMKGRFFLVNGLTESTPRGLLDCGVYYVKLWVPKPEASPTHFFGCTWTLREDRLCASSSPLVKSFKTDQADPRKPGRKNDPSCNAPGLRMSSVGWKRISLRPKSSNVEVRTERLLLPSAERSPVTTSTQTCLSQILMVQKSENPKPCSGDGVGFRFGGLRPQP